MITPFWIGDITVDKYEWCSYPGKVLQEHLHPAHPSVSGYLYPNHGVTATSPSSTPRFLGIPLSQPWCYNNISIQHTLVSQDTFIPAMVLQQHLHPAHPFSWNIFIPDMVLQQHLHPAHPLFFEYLYPSHGVTATSPSSTPWYLRIPLSQSWYYSNISIQHTPFLKILLSQPWCYSNISIQHTLVSLDTFIPAMVLQPWWYMFVHKMSFVMSHMSCILQIHYVSSLILFKFHSTFFSSHKNTWF